MLWMCHRGVRHHLPFVHLAQHHAHLACTTEVSWIVSCTVDGCTCDNDNNFLDDEVRRLKRRVDAQEREIVSLREGVVKVTRLVDRVSTDLTRRVVEVETELTYHADAVGLHSQ